MIDIVLTAEHASLLRSLSGGAEETCAVFFASEARARGERVRLLVREMWTPEETDYTRRGALEAELTPAFVSRAAKHAKREHLSLVFAHSHPGSTPPSFSGVDDDGERRLAAFLAHRLPEQSAHGALVVSSGGLSARALGSATPARVVSVGSVMEVVFDHGEVAQADERHDRQIRAFGRAGQAKIQGVSVAIVGLGGTGSLVAQQLAHLGVRDFILVDPDVVESSNLNRLANAGPADVGAPKVSVAEQYLRRVSPDATVESVQGDIIRAAVAHRLTAADVIFGCTDSHGSRAVLQQIAYQYLIPTIDMGTTIAVRESRITHVYGRVQLLAPGLACFTCGRLLDGNQVRRDMMTAFERKADPYISGAHEPAPSVISLNGTVASLAVTMFLSVVAGVPGAGRHLLYNALASSVRSVRGAPEPRCFVCSSVGALGRGDSWPLNARQD